MSLQKSSYYCQFLMAGFSHYQVANSDPFSCEYRSHFPFSDEAMSHPFGDLLTQYLHRRHGLSQAKLAAGILQTPSVISEMCKGQRLTGVQARERVLQIIGWLNGQGALTTTHDANDLLNAAGMAPLRQDEAEEAALLRALQNTPQSNGQSHHPGLATPEAAPTDTLPKTNLPTPLTNLIGRTHELAEVKTIIATHRFVTLTGPGGCGKTRLALSLAEQLRTAYSDGVYFVPLAPVMDPELIAPTIANAMGLSLEGSTEPHLQLFDFLRQKEPLLIVDNVEHLLPKVGLFTQLLEQAPHLRLLATSREPLHLYGEHNYRVMGLLPYAQQISDDLASLDIASLDAVRLFIHSAKRADAAFQPDQRDLEDILYICRLVDGLPLGIELAASWVTILSCAEIRAEMEGNLSALAAPYADVPQRHRSLSAVINHSWALLPLKEQSILQSLSVFRGGCSRAAAEQVAKADLSSLSALIEKSLLYRESTGRFSMHEVVRQFAYEQLVAQGQETEAKDRHLSYFVALAEQAEREILGPAQFDWVPRLDYELANFRAALSWCQDNPERLRQGMRLVGSLGWYGYLANHWREGLQRAEGFLRNTLPTDLSEERAMALFTAGGSLMLLDEHRAAMHYLQQSLAIARSIPGNWRLARTISILGISTLYLGHIAEAQALFEEALTLSRIAGDQADYLFALEHMGEIFLAMGDYERAYGVLQECLTVNNQIGYTISLPQTLIDLARVKRALGDLESATTHLEKTQVFADQLGIVRFQSQIQSNLGWIALQRTAPAVAQKHFMAALRLFRKVGDRMGIADALEGLAVVDGVLGNWEQAALHLGATDSLREQISVPIPAENRSLIDETRNKMEQQVSAYLESGRTMVLDRLLDKLLE